MATTRRPPPKPPPADLAEVERALSILEGRHPDQVRVERETHEAVRARHAADESVRAVERAVVRRKRLLWGAPVVLLLCLLGAAAFWAEEWDARAKRADALIAPVVAGYTAHGFHEAERSAFSSHDRVERDVEAGQCFVALATSTSGDTRMQVERGGAVFSASGSAGWCTCRVEHVKLSALAEPQQGAVGLVQIDARTVGGVLAMPFLEPHPAVLASVEECATEQLDAWLATQPSTAVSPDPASGTWLKEDPRAKKLREGSRDDDSPAPTILRVVAGVEPTAPFGVVAIHEPACALAVSSDDGDLLTLRITGDTRPLSKVRPPLAWCDAAGKTVTLWHEGRGRVVVLAAPAERLGGMLGLRELAARAGFTGLSSWVGEADLDWSAAAVLRASGVAASDITARGSPVPAARVVASAMGHLVPKEHDIDTFVCGRELESAESSSSCAQAVPLTWTVAPGQDHGGIAQGALPFWMDVYARVTGAAALPREVELMALARLLASQGFEPTYDNFTDISSGIDVLGLAGDTAIVAVGMLAEPPWVVTFTDRTTPWNITGEPRFVATTPGIHVKLTSKEWSHVPAAMRHAVVFRKGRPAPLRTASPL